MVDHTVLAAKIAAVSDAVARIRQVLPPTTEEFRRDRTAREIVTLNLFVGLQECLALATHWLADEGWSVPNSYADVFRALADHGVINEGLARRLVAASGFRNLVAHQYGVIDADRLHAIASADLADLLEFCRELANRARGQTA